MRVIIGQPNPEVNRQTGAIEVQNSDMDETQSLDTLGKRLKWARRRAKLTQLQVRKRIGISQSNLSELEGDAYLASAFVPQLANLYGVRALWLSNKQGPVLESDLLPSANGPNAPRHAQSNAEEAPALGALTKVPVVGSAKLGDNGFRAELEYPVGHGDGFVEFPSRDKQAYALRCIGDSMRPRIKDGEFVVIYPGHAPMPGDEVLVKTTDGRVMVKELAYVRDDVMTLLSVNETHGKLHIPLQDVECCHYVAAIVKRPQWMPV